MNYIDRTVVYVDLTGSTIGFQAGPKHNILSLVMSSIFLLSDILECMVDWSYQYASYSQVE